MRPSPSAIHDEEGRVATGDGRAGDRGQHRHDADRVVQAKPRDEREPREQRAEDGAERVHGVDEAKVGNHRVVGARGDGERQRERGAEGEGHRQQDRRRQHPLLNHDLLERHLRVRDELRHRQDRGIDQGRRREGQSSGDNDAGGQGQGGLAQHAGTARRPPRSRRRCQG